MCMLCQLLAASDPKQVEEKLRAAGYQGSSIKYSSGVAAHARLSRTFDHVEGLYAAKEGIAVDVLDKLETAAMEIAYLFREAAELRRQELAPTSQEERKQS